MHVMTINNPYLMCGCGRYATTWKTHLNTLCTLAFFWWILWYNQIALPTHILRSSGKMVLYEHKSLTYTWSVVLSQVHWRNTEVLLRLRGYITYNTSHRSFPPHLWHAHVYVGIKSLHVLSFSQCTCNDWSNTPTTWWFGSQVANNARETSLFTMGFITSSILCIWELN